MGAAEPAGRRRGRPRPVGVATGPAGRHPAGPGRARGRRAVARRRGGQRRPAGACSSPRWRSGCSRRSSRRGPPTPGGPGACWGTSWADPAGGPPGAPTSSVPPTGWRPILDRLARLDVVEGSGGATVDHRTFAAALEAELADSLATLGRLGEGLFIGPVPLAVGIDADLVIVLGLVEGGLPGGLGDDPLLSERSRRALDGALTTAVERREALHHQLLAVAGAADATVVASRPRADLRRGTARYPSRWLDAVAALGPAGPAPSARVVPGRAPRRACPRRTSRRLLLDDLHRLASTGHAAGASIPWPARISPCATRCALVRARASDALTAFDGNLAALAASGVDLLGDHATSADRARGVGQVPLRLLRPLRAGHPRGRRARRRALHPSRPIAASSSIWCSTPRCEPSSRPATSRLLASPGPTAPSPGSWRSSTSTAGRRRSEASSAIPCTGGWSSGGWRAGWKASWPSTPRLAPNTPWCRWRRSCPSATRSPSPCCCRPGARSRCAARSTGSTPPPTG